MDELIKFISEIGFNPIVNIHNKLKDCNIYQYAYYNYAYYNNNIKSYYEVTITDVAHSVYNRKINIYKECSSIANGFMWDEFENIEDTIKYLNKEFNTIIRQNKIKKLINEK